VKLKRALRKMIVTLLGPIVSLKYKSRLNEAVLQKKKVLFVANNELMFQHIAQVWNAYHRKEEYEVHLCSTESIVVRAAKYKTLRRMKALARSRGIKFWPDFIAGKIEWDLLITAEPDIPCHLLGNRTRRILLQHALIGIKKVDGFLYPYHPDNFFTGRDKCKFDSIFETNCYTYNKLIEQDSRYSGVIKLVGSMPADALLELNKSRSQIRDAMGYHADDYVVLIQSTFRESLIEDLGVELLEQCRTLSLEKNYKFIISLHPNHWRGDYATKHPWGRIASTFESDRIKIRRPDEDANLSLIASDIAVTDHTSLSYNYMLLNKPALFYLPPSGNQVMDILGELVECCATFAQPCELSEKLQEATRVFDKDKCAVVIARCLPYLGKARERNNEILDEILNKE